jgi:hypothetical protein
MSKKQLVTHEPKIFYAVEDTDNAEELYPMLTLEEAYNNYIENAGIAEKLYAYKIELLGEVKQELTIKK